MNHSFLSVEAHNMRDLILQILLSDFISDWLAASTWRSAVHLFAVWKMGGWNSEDRRLLETVFQTLPGATGYL